MGEERTPRCRCANWRLAVAVAIPNLAVIACLAIGLYTYLTFTSRDMEADENRDIFIQFDSRGDININETLNFTVQDRNKVDLVEGTKIYISCSGPYLLHMDVCFRGLDNKDGQGKLELLVAAAGQQASLASFPLEGKSKVNCKGLHTTVYLRSKEEATLHFSSEGNNLKIKNIMLGLHYQLGRQCL
ncbi:unnamed protein product [Merluccius merluccius]